MNVKKRIFAAFMASALAVTALAGCGGSKSEAAPAGSGAAASGDQMKVTLVMALRDEWLSALENGAKNNCPANVALTTQDAQNDTSKQLQMIESAVNGGADAVIVNMVDPATADACKEAAKGTPIVFVNRYPADDSILDDTCVYVGSDEMTSGAFQGEWLAQWAKDNGKDSVKYVMLNGTLGQTSTENRTKSFRMKMEEEGIGLELVGSELACDYDRAKAMDKFTPVIGQDFDVIVSNNDAMALGAVEALEQKGKNPADTPILGIDASTDGRQAVKDGKLAMSVFQDPTGQGKGCIMAAVNLVKGNALDQDTDFSVDETGHILWVPFEPVTAENVAEYDNR